VERVQEFFKPEPVKPQPDDLKTDEPEPKPTKPTTKKIQVNLTKVTRTTTTKTTDTSEADERREAQRAAEARARAFKNAASSISKNTSSSTVVDMPGASTAAYATYTDALASIYYDAWTPPDDTSNDDAITKVSITIDRDGTVVSAQIVGRSGDARVDASVQQAIDRVKNVPPLPAGSKESRRKVILNFNLKTKRMIG
jgi:TonB family protein